MSKAQTLSLKEARRLAVAHQGLHTTRPFGKGKRAVYEVISHLGYVQIDTISVAARAHHHVLWTRVPDYREKHLLDLQVKDRLVLEYWAHAAAYLPMQDYRFCLPTMQHFRDQRDGWPKADRKTKRLVLDRIRAEGPLMSRDFAHPPRKGGSSWWDWKPAKLALQRLFFSGEILISHREGFQRVYDLPERILPAHVDTTVPTDEEYARHLILGTIRAHGLARVQEMYYLRKGLGELVRGTLNEMVAAGEVREIAIKGIRNPFYSTDEALNTSVRISNQVKLLSPFDNMVIQRNRLSDLFDFDYQIEVYLPQPKRKYGYYCLPILKGDRFYGRVDVKADRKQDTLRLLHVHLEPDAPTQDLNVKLISAFRDFAALNDCDAIAIRKTTPPNWKQNLQNHV